jgi:hypothetical protein
MMRGGTRRPLEPSKPWMSLPQMPHALICTNTSCSPTSGSGMSVMLSLLYSSNSSAFMWGEEGIRRILASKGFKFLLSSTWSDCTKHDKPALIFQWNDVKGKVLRTDVAFP